MAGFELAQSITSIFRHGETLVLSISFGIVLLFSVWYVLRRAILSMKREAQQSHQSFKDEFQSFQERFDILMNPFLEPPREERSQDPNKALEANVELSAAYKHLQERFDQLSLLFQQRGQHIQDQGAVIEELQRKLAQRNKELTQVRQIINKFRS